MAIDAAAQRLVDGERLYGYEWIRDGVDYLKVSVSEGGVYRITFEDLSAAGWDVLRGEDLKLEQYGEEVPLYVPEAGTWSAGDYAEFVNDPARRIAYENELYVEGVDPNLNPDYAIFSDTVIFALSSQAGDRLRYRVAEGAYVGDDNASTQAYAEAIEEQESYRFIKHTGRDDERFSSFRLGEGWGSPLSKSFTRNLATPHSVTDRPAIFTIKVAASYADPSEFDTRFRGFIISVNGEEVQTVNATNYELKRLRFEVPASLLEQEVQRLSIAGQSGANWDRYSLGMSRLLYPATLDVGDGQLLRRPFTDDLIAGRHAWSDLDPSLDYTVYDPVDRRVQLLPRGTTATSVLPELSDGSPLYVASSSNAKRAAYGRFDLSILTNLDDSDYYIVTDRKFAVWETSPKEYANMRRRANFGAHQVKVVYVQQLMDAYGYGQIGDSRGIRNAIQFFAAEGNAKHVLLLGKGREFDVVRTPAQIALPRNGTNYVPTFGLPGSDNLLAVDQQSHTMTVSIGRLAVETSDELRVIVDKVESTAQARQLPQTIGNHAWQKKVIHLSGGSGAGEQLEIKRRMARMQRVFQSTPRAPLFEFFGKNSSQPVQESERKQIYSSINGGAALITFFGHASTSTFDFNIDSPEFYDNEGRYPTLMALGCYAGNVHLPGKSVGERFLLYEHNGFNAFGATIGIGFTSDLELFASNVYSRLGNVDRDKPFSVSLQGALNIAFSSNSTTLQQLAEQFTFQGDPAMLMYSDPGADYIVDTDSVTVSVDDQNNIRYDAVIRNVGLLQADSLIVRVLRRSPSRRFEEVDSFSLAPFGNRIVVSRQVAGWAEEDAGLNALRFEIVTSLGLEAPQPGAVTNNTSSDVEFIVGLSNAQIAWPLQDALLEKDSIRFAAYVSDIFGQPKQVTWELGSDPNFSAVLLSKTELVRGVFEWRPEFDYSEGGTYYCRVRGEEGTKISSSTITFSVAENGSLPQGAYHASLQTPDQLTSGSIQEGIIVDSLGEFSFQGTGYYIGLRNLEYGPAGEPALSYNFETPASSFRPWYALTQGLGIGYTNPRTGYLVFNDEGDDYGAVPSTRRSFAFPTETEAQRANIIKFLKEAVPDSSIVIVMSLFREGQTFDFSAWQNDARPLGNFLDSMGASQANEWVSGETRPYNLVLRKGVELMAEEVGSSRSDVLATTTFFEIYGNSGSFTTAPIRVPGDYQSIAYEFEDGMLDSFSVALVRNDIDTNVIVQLANTRRHSFDISTLGLTENSKLSLRAYQKDTTYFSAKSLKGITVSLLPYVDLAVNSMVGDVSGDTLSAGQKMETQYQVVNMSPTLASSVRLQLTHRVGANGVTASDTLEEIAPWTYTDANMALIPYPLTGPTSIRYGVSLLQPERTIANNLAERDIVIESDDIAPGVTVLVDGKTASPGRMLLSDPTFQIVVRDDNLYQEIGLEQLVLHLTDAAGQTLTHSAATLPGEVDIVERKIGPDDLVSGVTFEYRPTKLADGQYELRASVADQSGNQDRTPQTVRFELDNRTAVSNVLPYPNPGVDNIKFQYEATGTVPQQYQIDIYTTTGRQICSLTQNQLGPLRRGRHLTSGAWDGTDQFGQRLARGIYLYRFTTSDETGEIEQRFTDIDKYINSGFGKLVLIR